MKEKKPQVVKSEPIELQINSDKLLYILQANQNSRTDLKLLKVQYEPKYNEFKFKRSFNRENFDNVSKISNFMFNSEGKPLKMRNHHLILYRSKGKWILTNAEKIVKVSKKYDNDSKIVLS